MQPANTPSRQAIDPVLVSFCLFIVIDEASYDT